MLELFCSKCFIVYVQLGVSGMNLGFIECRMILGILNILFLSFNFRIYVFLFLLYMENKENRGWVVN